MTWESAVNALTPRVWLRLDEASGNPVDEVNSLVFTANGSPTYSEASLVPTDANAAMTFNTPTAGPDYLQSTNFALFSGTGGGTNWSISFFISTSETSGDPVFNFGTYGGANSIDTNVDTDTFSIRLINFLSQVDVITVNGLDLSAAAFVVFTFDNGAWALYVDGAEVDSGTATNVTAMSPNTQPIRIARHSGSGAFAGTLDEIIFFDSTLAAGDVSTLYAEATGNFPPDIIPVKLQGWLSQPAASIPVKLQTITQHPAASIPVKLQGPDPAHYGAAVTTWSALVELAGTDITAQLVGPISIEHEETTSGLASFSIYPPTGALDPADYERQAVAITFEGRDSGGAVTYRSRRFTGISSTAVFDPDRGVLRISATTDLQGKLEQYPRAAIDQVIGGQWSEHVFDDTADGWQYAQDRLSTIPAEMHIDNYGHLVVIPWAPGAVDVTLTDSARFNDTLELERVSSRDLLTRIDLTFDFRFTRLRHREMSVAFIDNIGLCGYLDGEAEFAAKDMIYQAADANPWTRISPITFTELPAAGAYCDPVRVWIGDPRKVFCMAASWRAAYRWAQTITEVYSIAITATDLEQAVGRLAVGEDYGIEAIYDASEYERDRSFSQAPAGSVFSSKTNDYQIDATAAERTGRAALEAAQECAISAARVEILGRARRNRVRLSPVYDPSITLASTVRVNTPHLVATGKVYALRETLDPIAGAVELDLELAISRHGGSGLAVDDPVTAPATPDQEQETNTGRVYVMQTHAGGVTGAPPDSDALEGWITNAYGPARTDPSNLYRERFFIRMPEIEGAARQKTEVAQAADYILAVPEDELTLSN